MSVQDLEVKAMERKIEFKNNDATVFLDDPNPEMTIEEVLEFYSLNYPTLLNATYEQVILGENIVYKVKSIAGSKG